MSDLGLAERRVGTARTSPALQLVRVAKEYDHGAIRALAGVDLTVPCGEFIAVTGRSGCGKSTLLHLVAALEWPTSGQILVHGRDLRRHPDLDAYRRSEIGLVFQLHNLLPHLDAVANIEIAMMGTPLGRRAKHARAGDLLDAVGLGHRARTRPPSLSGGERQRLAIARALANDPAMLLADEPTGALDSAAVDDVLALLARIRSERHITIVLVTHDPLVSAHADRVVELRDGAVVDRTSPVARARTVV
jgi:putative ABC transport system ATP-binding protein